MCRGGLRARIGTQGLAKSGGQFGNGFAAGTRGGGETPRADLHPGDEERIGPRRKRPVPRSGKRPREEAGGRAARPDALDFRASLGDVGGKRTHPGRLEDRVWRNRRPPRLDRRGFYARLFPLLARRRVPTRIFPSVSRQAVHPRLARKSRLEQNAAGAAASARRHRGNTPALPRRVQTIDPERAGEHLRPPVSSLRHCEERRDEAICSRPRPHPPRRGSPSPDGEGRRAESGWRVHWSSSHYYLSNAKEVRVKSLRFFWFSSFLLASASVASARPASAPAGDEAAVKIAVAQFYAALNTMFTGDLGPMKEVWSHTDDVTYMGPGGGFQVG